MKFWCPTWPSVAGLKEHGHLWALQIVLEISKQIYTSQISQTDKMSPSEKTGQQWAMTAAFIDLPTTVEVICPVLLSWVVWANSTEEKGIQKKKNTHIYIQREKGYGKILFPANLKLAFSKCSFILTHLFNHVVRLHLAYVQAITSICNNSIQERDM